MINYINGLFVDGMASKIDISEIGFLRSYGVFDFIRTYNRKPFLLEEHIGRLFNSAALANIKHIYTFSVIRMALSKLIDCNKSGELTFRIILTAGYSKDGFSVQGGKGNLYIIVKKLDQLAQKNCERGVKLVTDNYQRNLAEIKSLDYFNLASKRELLKDNNAFTLLYVYKKKVLEAAISNIFFISGKTIITPNRNILIGTTRNIILGLIGDRYNVEERAVGVEEMLKQEEVFITGTTQGVTPVIAIDDKIYSNGLPGKRTQKIIKMFNNYVQETSK